MSGGLSVLFSIMKDILQIYQPKPIKYTVWKINMKIGRGDLLMLTKCYDVSDQQLKNILTKIERFYQHIYQYIRYRIFCEMAHVCQHSLTVFSLHHNTKSWLWLDQSMNIFMFIFRCISLHHVLSRHFWTNNSGPDLSNILAQERVFWGRGFFSCDKHTE